MYADFYKWGKLSIEKDTKKTWLWNLCLNRIPIQSYNDPNEAAFDASKSDVGDPRINCVLQGNYAPSDLSQWLTESSANFEDKNKNN